MIDQVDLITHVNFDHEFSPFVSSLITTVCIPYLWLKSDPWVALRHFGGEIVIVIRWSAGSSSKITSAMRSVFPLPVPEVTNVSKPCRSARTTRGSISRSTQVLSVTLQQISQARCDDGKSFCSHCSSRIKLSRNSFDKRPSVITVKMS